MVLEELRGSLTAVVEYQIDIFWYLVPPSIIYTVKEEFSNYYTEIWGIFHILRVIPTVPAISM